MHVSAPPSGSGSKSQVNLGGEPDGGGDLRNSLHTSDSGNGGCTRAAHAASAESATSFRAAASCSGVSVALAAARKRGSCCMKTPLKEKRSPPADDEGSWDESHCRVAMVRLTLLGSRSTVASPSLVLVLVVRCVTTASSTAAPILRKLVSFVSACKSAAAPRSSSEAGDDTATSARATKPCERGASEVETEI